MATKKQEVVGRWHTRPVIQAPGSFTVGRFVGKRIVYLNDFDGKPALFTVHQASQAVEAARGAA